MYLKKKVFLLDWISDTPDLILYENLTRDIVKILVASIISMIFSFLFVISTYCEEKKIKNYKVTKKGFLLLNFNDNLENH